MKSLRLGFCGGLPEHRALVTSVNMWTLHRGLERAPGDRGLVRKLEGRMMARMGCPDQTSRRTQALEQTRKAAAEGGLISVTPATGASSATQMW